MRSNKRIIIILIIIIAILAISLIGAIVYIFIEKDKSNSSNNQVVVDIANSNKNNSEEEINNVIENSVQNGSDNLAVKSFNSMFESYEGTEISGIQGKTLISTIETNNQVRQDGHIVIIDSTGITTVEQLEQEKKYTVILSYDNEGYINKVKIAENTTVQPGENINQNSSDMEKLTFNTMFTSYLGEITGIQLNSLIAIVQDNNTNNPNCQIAVTSSNLQGLDGIVETDIYIATLSYNDEGYVNSINVDKKM